MKLISGFINMANSALLLFQDLWLKSGEINLVKQATNCSVTELCDVVAFTKEEE